MKKKLRILFVCLFCLLAESKAQDFSIDGVNYTITDTDAKTVAIASGSCYDGDLVLTTVIHETVEYSITNLVESAFEECSSLISIKLPNSVTTIEGWAFLNCTNLTSIILPNSLIEIGESAFFRCYSLTSITIPNSVKYIGEFTFWGCSGLSSIVFPNSIRSIEEGVFYRCNSLTNFTIPNSVTYIGEWAFYRCESLTSITIPNSVIKIANFAFSHCLSLRSVTFPSSLEYLGDYIFNLCSSLITINCNATTPIIIGPGAFVSDRLSEMILQVPKGRKTAYEASAVWQDFGTIVEMDNLSVGTTGTEKNIALKITSSSLEILNTDTLTIGQLQLFNALGEHLKTSTTSSIDITSLPNGVYILYVHTNKGAFSKKFIKK